MARLRNGERSHKEGRVETVLRRHMFGLRESEIASELGVFPTRVRVNRL